MTKTLISFIFITYSYASHVQIAIQNSNKYFKSWQIVKHLIFTKEANRVLREGKHFFFSYVQSSRVIAKIQIKQIWNYGTWNIFRVSLDLDVNTPCDFGDYILWLPWWNKKVWNYCDFIKTSWRWHRANEKELKLRCCVSET